MQYPEFRGKTAIFTGAASGMGLLCSQCFAAEGGNVVMVDVNAEVLRKEADAINATVPGSLEEGQQPVVQVPGGVHVSI